MSILTERSRANERRLRSLWAKEDRLEAELKRVRTEARRLANEVGRSHGLMCPSRETMQRTLALLN
jgi:hypothetical protein